MTIVSLVIKETSYTRKLIFHVKGDTLYTGSACSR